MCLYPEISGGFNKYIETCLAEKAESANATNYL